MRAGIVIAVLGACGNSSPAKPTAPISQTRAALGDQCPAAVDRLLAVMAGEGSGPDPAKRERAIAECRQKPDDPLVGCILAAAPTDDAAVLACLRPPAQGEPLDQLRLAVDALRTYYFVHETFTDIPSTGLVPAAPCCSFPRNRCPPEAAPNETLVNLAALDLSTSRAYQYRFESTGSRAVLEAVGDPDCDGTSVTYRRVLEWRSDGNMHITVEDPPAGSD